MDNSNVPTFNGRRFADWSMKMKRLLMIMGLWYVVEQGLKKLRPTVTLPEHKMAVLKKEKVHDSEAIAKIHEHLSSSISMRYFNATTAKETWDFLHEDYQMNDSSPAPVEELPSTGSMRNTDRAERSQTERMKSDHRHASEGGLSTEPIRSARQIEIQRGKRKMNDGPTASKRPILEAEKTQESSEANPSRTAGTAEERAFPNSILKTGKRKTNEPQRTSDEGSSEAYTHFYMVLRKIAVKPAYSFKFPVGLAFLLPSNNMTAIVKCTSGDTYKILYLGKRKQKMFGYGWKKLVIEQNLVEGDEVRFDIIKSRPNELELKLHISPPDPQEGFRRNGTEYATIIMECEDDSTDDDNDNEENVDGDGEKVGGGGGGGRRG